MGSDQRLVVLVRGVTEKSEVTTSARPDTSTPSTAASGGALELVPSPRWLYLSVLGPTSDGKVTHTMNVYVPKRFPLVEVKAWTGPNETPCSSRVEKTKGIRPAEEVGCIVLRLP
jgi:hypothetical protein